MQISYQQVGRHRLVLVSAHGSGPGGGAEQLRVALRSVAETLADRGLGLEHVVRSRLWARDAVYRGAASPVRPEVLTGPARSASSSYVRTGLLPSGVLVGIDVVAYDSPGAAPVKTVVEHDPPQVPIRYLTVEDLVVHSGTTSLAPTLDGQVEQIAANIDGNLREAGSDPARIAELRCYLHRGEDPRGLSDAVARHLPGPVAFPIELVDGFSAPGKLVELEVTALH